MNVISRLRIEKNNLIRNKKDSIISLTKNVESKSLVVLANGPSLSQSISENYSDLKNSDIICLNGFPVSDLFVELHPKYWVLVDPFYFDMSISEVGNGEAVNDYVTILKNNVTWDLTVFFPEYSKNLSRFGDIIENPHITVKYFSDFCIDFECKSDKEEERLYRLLQEDKICPPSQTVSCLAISLGIFMGYKRIIIYGLDMSMFRNHFIDQKTNQNFIRDEHFYDMDRQTPYALDASIGWYLNAYSKMFLQMEFLNRYAKYRGISVINRSALSYVDAFDRE